MPRSRKRTDRKSDRPVTYRPVSPVLLTAFSAGIRSIPAPRSLDSRAVSDALNRLASQSRLGELQAMGSAATESELKAFCDMLAAENPADQRWDDWRNYRKSELSYAN
jgi:hypothetical protein